MDRDCCQGSKVQAGDTAGRGGGQGEQETRSGGLPRERLQLLGRLGPGTHSSVQTTGNQSSVTGTKGQSLEQGQAKLNLFHE